MENLQKDGVEIGNTFDVLNEIEHDDATINIGEDGFIHTQEDMQTMQEGLPSQRGLRMENGSMLNTNQEVYTGKSQETQYKEIMHTDLNDNVQKITQDNKGTK